MKSSRSGRRLVTTKETQKRDALRFVFFTNRKEQFLWGTASLHFAPCARHLPKMKFYNNTFVCALFLFALLSALLGPASSAAAPRRALLVDTEVGLAVDPIGVVRSVEKSSAITFNFFCEFVWPLLDEETLESLPAHVCNGKRGRG